MAGETLSLTDVDVYFAKQSAKGTAAPGPFLTAMKFTQFNMTVNKDVLDGVPGLGTGLAAGLSLGIAYDVQWTANFQVNLKTLPTFLYDWFATRTTTNSTTLYTHTWGGIQRNSLLPRGSMIAVYGEGLTRGAGLVVRGVRDIKLTGLNYTISGQAFVEGSMSGIGLNWGPTAGTETFTADTATAQPAPSTFDTFTMPAGWGLSGSLCTESIGFTWRPQFRVDNSCYGVGEKSDIVLSSYVWDVAYQVRYDSVAIEAENYINTGNVSLGAATPFGALSAGIRTGTLAYNIGTLENIGASAPLNVPYQLGGSLPMQWKNAQVNSSQSPVTMTMNASTYDYSWTQYVKSNLAAVDMAW